MFRKIEKRIQVGHNLVFNHQKKKNTHPQIEVNELAPHPVVATTTTEGIVEPQKKKTQRKQKEEEVAEEQIPTEEIINE